MTPHPHKNQPSSWRNELEAALNSYFDAIQKLNTPAGKNTSLLPLFEQIDRLYQDFPQGEHPHLRHFLEQKSYEKALKLLRSKP